jgi:ATP-dependent Clp protease ATP-binding subunit ClpC
MFERMTDNARSVMVLAQEEARLLSHGYVGTEHLLLGLIHEARGDSATVLDSVGICFDVARAQVEMIVGKGDHRPSGHLPFTPNAEAALRRSSRLANTFAHQWIATEHLLLALIGGHESSALHVLRALNVDLDTLRVLLVAEALREELTSEPVGQLLERPGFSDQ